MLNPITHKVVTSCKLVLIPFIRAHSLQSQAIAVVARSLQVVVASAFDDNMGGSSPDFGAAGALFLRDGAMANITTSTFTGNHAAM